MKKIGIIGSGVVGQALANGFIKHGYEVMIGTRDGSKLEEWLSSNSSNGHIGTVPETVGFADTLVLAVKGTVAKNVINSIGADALAGKVILDATNPIDDSPPENGVLRYFTNINKSLMEELQDLAPGAHFVKCFSCVGNAFMVNPSFDSKPTMFIAGNDDAAKIVVKEILDTFGWEHEDMGTAEGARAIEPLAMLWCIPGIRSNQWTHAFKLLKL